MYSTKLSVHRIYAKMVLVSDREEALGTLFILPPEIRKHIVSYCGSANKQIAFSNKYIHKSAESNHLILKNLSHFYRFF